MYRIILNLVEEKRNIQKLGIKKTGEADFEILEKKIAAEMEYKKVSLQA